MVALFVFKTALAYHLNPNNYNDNWFSWSGYQNCLDHEVGRPGEPRSKYCHFEKVRYNLDVDLYEDFGTQRDITNSCKKSCARTFDPIKGACVGVISHGYFDSSYVYGWNGNLGGMNFWNTSDPKPQNYCYHIFGIGCDIVTADYDCDFDDPGARFPSQGANWNCIQASTTKEFPRTTRMLGIHEIDDEFEYRNCRNIEKSPPEESMCWIGGWRGRFSNEVCYMTKYETDGMSDCKSKCLARSTCDGVMFRDGTCYFAECASSRGIDDMGLMIISEDGDDKGWVSYQINPRNVEGCRKDECFLNHQKKKYDHTDQVAFFWDMDLLECQIRCLANKDCEHVRVRNPNAPVYNDMPKHWCSLERVEDGYSGRLHQNDSYDTYVINDKANCSRAPTTTSEPTSAEIAPWEGSEEISEDCWLKIEGVKIPINQNDYRGPYPYCSGKSSHGEDALETAMEWCMSDGYGSCRAVTCTYYRPEELTCTVQWNCTVGNLYETLEEGQFTYYEPLLKTKRIPCTSSVTTTTPTTVTTIPTATLEPVTTLDSSSTELTTMDERQEILDDCWLKIEDVTVPMNPDGKDGPYPYCSGKSSQGEDALETAMEECMSYDYWSCRAVTCTYYRPEELTCTMRYNCTIGNLYETLEVGHFTYYEPLLKTKRIPCTVTTTTTRELSWHLVRNATMQGCSPGSASPLKLDECRTMCEEMEGCEGFNYGGDKLMPCTPLKYCTVRDFREAAAQFNAHYMVYASDFDESENYQPWVRQQYPAHFTDNTNYVNVNLTCEHIANSLDWDYGIEMCWRSEITARNCPDTCWNKLCHEDIIEPNGRKCEQFENHVLEGILDGSIKPTEWCKHHQTDVRKDYCMEPYKYIVSFADCKATCISDTSCSAVTFWIADLEDGQDNYDDVVSACYLKKVAQNKECQPENIDLYLFKAGNYDTHVKGIDCAPEGDPSEQEWNLHPANDIKAYYCYESNTGKQITLTECKERCFNESTCSAIVFGTNEDEVSMCWLKAIREGKECDPAEIQNQLKSDGRFNTYVKRIDPSTNEVDNDLIYFDLCMRKHYGVEVVDGICNKELLAEDLTPEECVAKCRENDSCIAADAWGYNPSGLNLWRGSCFLELKDGESTCDATNIESNLSSDFRNWLDVYVKIDCNDLEATTSTTTPYFEQCWCKFHDKGIDSDAAKCDRREVATETYDECLFICREEESCRAVEFELEEGRCVLEFTNGRGYNDASLNGNGLTCHIKMSDHVIDTTKYDNMAIKNACDATCVDAQN